MLRWLKQFFTVERVIRRGSLVVDTEKKIWVVNEVANQIALVDDFLWNEDRHKAQYCKVVEVSSLTLIK